MVDHVTHKSTGKTLTIIGLVILLLLLWHWLRNRGANIVNNNIKGGDVVLQGVPNTTYNVPGLKNPGDVWDWIHACDLGCECGPLPHKVGAVPLSFDPMVLPIMVYINPPRSDLPASVGGYPAAPSFNFPSFTAPALPEWWYEAGYNAHHEDANYVMTETGTVGILGKYYRSGWPIGTNYQYQTKDVVINGEDAFIDGKHYKHNPKRDVKTRPPRPIETMSGTG